MKLTFEKVAVRRLIDHARSCKAHRKAMGKGETGPGLWLVVDHGIYLISNGLPGLQRTGEHQAFAQEANPQVMPEDAWYQAKREAAGPHDSVDFVPADLVERGLLRDDAFVIDLTPDEYTVVLPAPFPDQPA